MKADSIMHNCVFYQSPSAQPRPCAVTANGAELLIYFQDPAKGFVSWNRLSLNFSRDESGKLLIKKEAMTVEAHGDSATQLFFELSQPAEIKKSSGFFKPSHLAVIALGGLVITAVVVMMAYLLLPLAASRIAGMVPLEYEVQLGESMAEAYTAESEANDSADYYVARYVKKLKLDTEYPIKAKVIMSDEINAFALPGGNIFIYSGLLKKMDDHEQLAALLGHEISHVTQRHSLKSMFSSAAAGILIGTVFGDMGGLSSWALSQADHFKQLDYSRELEMEADNHGLKILRDNHISPKAMVGLLKLLKQEGAETPGLMRYLSTHPETEERIRNAEQDPGSGTVSEKNEEMEKIFSKLKGSLEAGERSSADSW